MKSMNNNTKQEIKNLVKKEYKRQKLSYWLKELNLMEFSMFLLDYRPSWN